MKQLVMIASMLFLIQTTWAQNVIERHFQDYQERDNVTSIHVTAKTFELASYIELEDADQELEDFLEFVKTIKTFDMIVGQEIDQPQKEYLRSLGKIGSSFEELMNVEDEDGTFSFFIDESNGVVYELVMVGMGQQELMIFSLTGNMDLRQLSKMAQKIQMDGYGQMGKLSAYHVGDVTVYPNPAKVNTQLNIEIPEDMVGGVMTIYSINGSVIRQITLSDLKQSFNTKEMSSGMHVLEFKKNGLSIKKKLMVH